MTIIGITTMRRVPERESSTWLCIQFWNCINTRNLGKLQEKLTFMKFLYADKTDLYMQFMSNYMTWTVYLGSVYDNQKH